MADADDSYDFTQPDALRRQAARGIRAGDGQPLPGRNPPRRDAPAASLPRQSRPHRPRPPVLPQPVRRLPLRHARLPAGCGAGAWICRPPAWSSRRRWWSRRRCSACASAKCRPRCRRTGAAGRPHLRTWRDGWRHLRFLMLFSPRWLFLYPGALLMLAGIVTGVWLLPEPRTIGGVSFDVHTLAVRRRRRPDRLPVDRLRGLRQGLRDHRRPASRGSPLRQAVHHHHAGVGPGGGLRVPAGRARGLDLGALRLGRRVVRGARSDSDAADHDPGHARARARLPDRADQLLSQRAGHRRESEEASR